MDSIIASVGGQQSCQDSATHGAPSVVTHVTTVQATALPDLSGIVVHLTGLITFLEEGQMRQFSQTVFLEPSKVGEIFVRNDIVQYIDTGERVPDLPEQVNGTAAMVLPRGAESDAVVEAPPRPAAVAAPSAEPRTVAS